jgi:hypothetical protein
MKTFHRAVAASFVFVLLAALGSIPVGAAGADPSIAHIDGYLSITQGERGASCIIIRQHDGSLYSLQGRVVGLMQGDHVRLEGRVAPQRCGAQGFDVSVVQTIWGDDRHKTTYYDHLTNGGFPTWAAKNGRVHGEPEWRGYPPNR